MSAGGRAGAGNRPPPSPAYHCITATGVLGRSGLGVVASISRGGRTSHHNARLSHVSLRHLVGHPRTHLRSAGRHGSTLLAATSRVDGGYSGQIAAGWAVLSAVAAACCCPADERFTCTGDDARGTGTATFKSDAAAFSCQHLLLADVCRFSGLADAA